MKSIKIIFTLLFVFTVSMVMAQIDSIAGGVQDIVDTVKDIKTPGDLLSQAELLIMLGLNVIGYLAGYFGFLKKVPSTTWVIALIAVVVGTGAVFFGFTDWVGAIKSYVMSASAYELFFKYLFGRSKNLSKDVQTN